MFAFGMVALPVLANDSGIEGIITVSPAHPGPIRIGETNSKPLADAEFVVRKDNSEVASFKTNARGEFRVSIPPGHYTVAANRKGRIGSFGPFEVDVSAGQMTQVKWACDSGMR